jgi:hypothetical protein
MAGDILSERNFTKINQSKQRGSDKACVHVCVQNEIPAIINLRPSISPSFGKRDGCPIIHRHDKLITDVRIRINRACKIRSLLLRPSARTIQRVNERLNDGVCLFRSLSSL